MENKVDQEFVTEKKYLIIHQIITENNKLLGETFAYESTYKEAIFHANSYARKLKLARTSVNNKEKIRTFIFKVTPNPIFEKEI